MFSPLLLSRSWDIQVEPKIRGGVTTAPRAVARNDVCHFCADSMGSIVGIGWIVSRRAEYEMK